MIFRVQRLERNTSISRLTVNGEMKRAFLISYARYEIKVHDASLTEPKNFINKIISKQPRTQNNQEQSAF